MNQLSHSLNLFAAELRAVRRNGWVNIIFLSQSIHDSKICNSGLECKYSGMKIITCTNICKLPIKGQNGGEVKLANGCRVFWYEH